MSAYQTPKRRRANSFSDFGIGLARTAGGALLSGLHGVARNLGADLAASAGNLVQDASHATTSAIRGAAERVAAGMAGGAAMDIGDSQVVPAQLIPGRGQELSFQQLNVLKPIKFKLGETPGPSLTDAFLRERMLFKGQSLMHAFAFKMNLVPPSYISASESIPINRFVVHNVFRHTLRGTTNTFYNGRPYGSQTQSWNATLGPDKSYVRQLGATTVLATPSGGSATSAVSYATLGLNTSLQSPYRYPTNGQFMYARLNRICLENAGWNANPMKVAWHAYGSGSVNTTTALQVYANASADYSGLGVSMPTGIPQNATPETLGPSFYYRSQMGRGKLSYNFSNDGTNPVVIDVVVTRVKKNCSLIKSEVETNMVAAYQQGYKNYSYANPGQIGLNGQPPQDVDVTTNARGPFLPAKALDNYKLVGTGNVANCPFKQIARDQFIISGGSTRNWSTQLQSVDYQASKYPQFQAASAAVGDTISSSDNTSNCADEFTYILSFACSGVPAPYVEFAGAAGNVASVIDRRGTDCSVSVTGSYKEYCHPVYLSKVLTETYINGRLDIPHYDTGNTPSLTTNDIANIGQAVRSAATSTALIGMGPFNTVGGG